MADVTTMTYGAYSFRPVPLMTLSNELQKPADQGEIIGEAYSISLRGTLIIPSGSGSIVQIRQKQDELLTAFSGDGRLFELKCGSTTLLQAYPRIRSVSFDEGIWVFQSPYTIELEFDELAPGSGTSFLQDASEDWSVEFGEQSKWAWTLPAGSGADTNPYRLRITHSLSATGKSRYNAAGLQVKAWQHARNYVIPRLGINTGYISNSGVFNMNAGSFSAYDHVRSIQSNEKAGTYSVTESWLVQETGLGGVPGNAIEDFTISLRQTTDSDLTFVGIEGTIQGVESRTYGVNPGDFTISETKYASASGTWNTVKNRLLGRSNLLLDTVATTRDLNIIPLSTSVGHNPNTGSISYSYEYNDRPANCVVGAKSETITITDTYPTDVFARLTVLGRAAGPVLQDLSTQTESTRSLSIEVVMAPATGCPTAGNVAAFMAQKPTAAVNVLISAIEADLSGNYSQFFKTEDQESWSPKDGRYSRNIGWLYQNCS